MSLFFTAPPVYNTGGFNTYYSGFGYSFNPTGIVPDTLESGSSDLAIGSEYYYSRSLYFDFKKELTLNHTAYSFHRFDYKQELTLNHAANEVGKAYLQGLPAINFASDLADKLGDFKVANVNYSFSSSPNIKSYAGIGLSSLFSFKRAKAYNTFSSSHIYRLKNEIAKRVDMSMGYFTIFPHLEAKNYLTVGIKHLISPDSQLAKRVDMSISHILTPRKEIYSRTLSPDISLAKRTDGGRVEGFNNINLIDYPYNRILYTSRNEISTSLNHSLSFEKIKKSYEVNLSHAPHSFHRAKIGNSPDLIDYYPTRLERTRNFLNTSFNYSSKKTGQIKSLRDLNLNYKKRETTNLAFSKTMGLSYIKRWEVLAGLGYQRNRSLIGPITYHDIDFSRGSFLSSNRLDTTEYLYQDKERAIGTRPSFPTGLEFPKIRYSTVEPDYTRAVTGSASHGVLVYEGVAAGNLFYYEPDQDSFKWGYFDYGTRSGIFNPCEFPETADRTLDPIQISSKSNKLDNPFWYLPDLLTVDSTIHTADGAPCQYIAQENSRFVGIYLTQSDSQLASDPVYLFPENFTQTGAVFTI